MTKKDEIIIDIIEKQLTRKEIAEKHSVSTTYVSQIKKSMMLSPIELLKFMNDFFNRFAEDLIKIPKIAMFVELNEEKFNEIEELIKQCQV